jgi:hypothetical protein
MFRWGVSLTATDDLYPRHAPDFFSKDAHQIKPKFEASPQNPDYQRHALKVVLQIETVC